MEDRPRKVLVIASTFPASDEDGVPAFVRDQISALKDVCASTDFTVLAPHHRDRTAARTEHARFVEHRFSYFFPRRLQRLAGHGIVPSIERNPFLIALVPFLFLGQLLAILKHVRRLDPDYLYAHWFTPQGVNAAVASKVTGIPWILTTHANDVRIWTKVPVVGRWLVRRLLPSARRITAVSESTRNKMRGFFSSDEWAALSKKVAIIPMGVDVDELASHRVAPVASLKARYGFDGEFVVLFLGRLASKKGVDQLVDAVARIAESGLRLVIAGDGPLQGALQRQVASAGLVEQTSFPGYLSGPTKRDYLHMADVVVVPSIETRSGDAEGLPVVVMEALAAGEVCIATDASGIGGVVSPGEDGFIVPQKDPEALAARILAVWEMGDARRREIGRRAQETAQQFAWPEIARRHCRFLFDT